ncbi:MAG TPA: DNA methyltransferase [Gallionella sp.]|nr:DNA methyltransferase [Gallionella sp.]
MALFRQPLFNPRLIAKRCPTAPTPAQHKRILHDWAQTIRDGSIARKSNKESAIRSAFIQKFFVEMLGYVPFGSGSIQTISEEHHTGAGSADAALGHFGAGENRILAPVELKGADTTNLDAIMPGRYKSPVQQAWEYAADIPGRKFIVLSNMVEIRLYAYAQTRQVYESFNILDLADSDAEYQRFRLLLGAENLLGGQTEKLLAESAAAEKAITRKLYSDYHDWRIQLILALAQHNNLPLPEIIAHAQTILDRILFIAFAEDRGLLPAKTIDGAYRMGNPLVPQPVWENFKGLFRAVDKGNAALGIPAYNGGLFKPDAVMDNLVVPDSTCEMFKQLAEYDFESEVSVTVLGRIFEQSVSDLEELHALTDLDTFRLKAREVRTAASGVTGKRKEHGIIYTPDDITAFLVEQTLGRYLHARREQLRATYLDSKLGADGELRYRKPTAAEKKQAGKVRDTNRLTEFLFWHHWRETLKTIKVLDPACGSGAFLIAAFSLLDAEYRQVNEQIQAITGNPDLFDINREILNGNLYGVDLNSESIEITKLSLWLKTAQYGKPLQTLEANLRVGNSLIAEMNGGTEFSARAFDWQGAFPEVFAAGGFDVVLGNPPYVRMELLKPIKPYLEKHYRVASDRADLYCYFYELGVNLLKPYGRLGYISSSTFFKTGSGEPLRRFLLERTLLRAVVDFGDLQVFEGVTTYPAIMVLEKAHHPNEHGNSPSSNDETSVGARFIAPASAKGRDESRPYGVENNLLYYLNLKTMPADGLSAAFAQQAQTMPQARLGAGSWQLESDARGQLRDKLTRGHATLRQVYGSPLYGIKTGLNEAFVIDRATRDALIAQDPKSAELLKPFLEGKDLKKWRIEPQDLWLIYIPKNRINIDDYPAIKVHLLPFKAQLEKRATKQAWFELQQAQAAYVPAFEGLKIVYGHFSPSALFSFETKSYYSNDKSYIIPNADYFLLGLLNSKICWSLISAMCPSVRGGFYEVRVQYIETLPIPAASAARRSEIATLAEACQRAAEARRDAQEAFRHRISDIALFTRPLPNPLPPAGEGTKLPSPTSGRGAGGEGSVKLNIRLQHWWELDFAAFRTEVKKLFKQDIPLAERNEWEAYFNRQRDLVQTFTAQIAQHEAALNRAVYALFNLAPEEVALIETGADA